LPGVEAFAGPLTIEQLAAQTGMSVRNIRAHQSRGLLPAPELRGRTGYYGRAHVERIERIQLLQAEGLNLEAIRRLLDEAAADELLRFTRSAREPFASERPRTVTLKELASRWRGDDGPRVLERALEVGFLAPAEGGAFLERSPRLARAAEELEEIGIPAVAGLEALASVKRHAEGIAAAYVGLFLARVWAPFEADGCPPERWPEVQEALDRLRPLAAESLQAVFGIAMSDAVEQALGERLERLGTLAPGR
jgi:DNA-binding transcriptional MerR regulator